MSNLNSIAVLSLVICLVTSACGHLSAEKRCQSICQMTELDEQCKYCNARSPISTKKFSAFTFFGGSSTTTYLHGHCTYLCSGTRRAAIEHELPCRRAVRYCNTADTERPNLALLPENMWIFFIFQ
ncbi:unnamed protein product [Nesidiocoris tenuis]|uniref:Uncharacterized protein n=1 Tax=Nesidiocoris tenuis TaxID=355587 RepID=A0A6H5HIM5_9HEMI|nr:unnamed protein product [Nesidiocoris tenuis]